MSAGDRQLIVECYDADCWAIGYPNEPIFYFGEEHIELAGKVVAAFNDFGADHVCKTLRRDDQAGTYVCVECYTHHLVVDGAVPGSSPNA